MSSPLELCHRIEHDARLLSLELVDRAYSHISRQEVEDQVDLDAYAKGQRSSRGIERAGVEDVAYRVIAANLAPDHVTIKRFRSEHSDALAGLFGSVLTPCARAGMVKVATIAVDGTKVHANASREANADSDQIAREILKEAAEVDGPRTSSPARSAAMSCRSTRRQSAVCRRSCGESRARTLPMRPTGSTGTTRRAESSATHRSHTNGPRFRRER